jgi:hypothetical protein
MRVRIMDILGLKGMTLCFGVKKAAVEGEK